MPLYKPNFSHGGGGVVTPGKANSITVKGPDGSVIYTGSGLVGSEGTKFQLPVGKIPPGSTFSIDDGTPFTIKDPSQRNEYGTGPDPTNVGGRGSLGGPGSAGPGNLQPSPFGAGYSPAYLGGQFPTFQPVKYNPINQPDFQGTNAGDFSSQYGQGIRNDILQNFGQSQSLALGTLATELQGLKAFAPAAAALARTTAAQDTFANQNLRTAQLQSTIPGALNNLSQQTSDAATYAQGKLPNSFNDTQLEYGIRSRAADNASTRGFGDNSLIGKSSSDLMSAEERFQIAQYGNTLGTQNAEVRNTLEVAPTEYINAGQQIRTMPTVSAGQYAQQYTNEANQLGLVNAGQAYQGTIGQNEFSAGQSLQTQEFNATNNLNTQQFNSTNGFAAQLGFFNYQNGFANNLAGLGTAQVDQQRADAQRQQLLDLYTQNQSSAQTTGLLSGLLNLGGNASSGGGGGILGSIFGGIGSLFGGGGSGGISPLTMASVLDPSSEFNLGNQFGLSNETGYGLYSGLGPTNASAGGGPASFLSGLGIDLGGLFGGGGGGGGGGILSGIASGLGSLF